jgi:hypothetical protein
MGRNNFSNITLHSNFGSHWIKRYNAYANYISYFPYIDSIKVVFPM